MSNRFDQMNLIPLWYTRRLSVRRWTRVWGCAAGILVPAVGVGVVLVHLNVVRPIDRLSNQVQQAARRVAELQSESGTRNAEVLSAAGFVDLRETHPEHWGMLLGSLAEMSAGDVGFLTVGIKINERHEMELYVEGLAAESQDVLRFAGTVERSGLFAPMSSPSITFENTTGSVRFEMTGTIPAVALEPGGRGS